MVNQGGKARYMEDFEKMGVLYLDRVPTLSPDIQQVYLPIYRHGGNLSYSPSVIGVAEVFYNSTKYKVAESKNYIILTPILDGLVSVDWSQGEVSQLEIADFEYEGAEGVYYDVLPSAAFDSKSYDKWKKLLSQYVRKEMPLALFYSPTLKEHSQTDENEHDFIIRMQHIANEKRDEDIDKVKKRFDSKITTLKNRLLRARQRVEKQNTTASQRKVDAVISMATALIGALFGKKVTKTSVSKLGTALKSTNRAMKSGESINQAEETMLSVEAELEELQVELEQEIDKISQRYDMENEKIEIIEIRPTANNITIQFIGLAWDPRG